MQGRNCRADASIRHDRRWRLWGGSPGHLLRWRGGPGNRCFLGRKRKSFYQRRLENKRKFSRNWRKVARKISKLDGRIANIRKDETHKFTSGYIKNHALIVLGNLHIKSMTTSTAGTLEQPGRKVKQKSGLNRAILRQGWGELGRQLEYKQS